MMTIRAFEAALLKREDRGFQLMSSGQEAVSVGLCAALEDGDQLLTSGRSIGPALARGIEPGRVMAELLGKVTGPNRGKAGRGHIADPSKGFMGAHAVVGGNLTIAAGVALAALCQGRPIAVACMFGDGACGSGALHETLNIAALWRLPLLFVCDNNQYSVSTPQREALAATPLSTLAVPFGMPARTIDGMDVTAVKDAAAVLLDHIRTASGPAFLECVSVRFMPHSTLTRETRSAAEVSAGKAHCPIARLSASLKESGSMSDDQLAVIEAEVASSIVQAMRFADESPYPNSDEARTDVA